MRCAGGIGKRAGQRERVRGKEDTNCDSNQSLNSNKNHKTHISIECVCACVLVSACCLHIFYGYLFTHLYIVLAIVKIVNARVLMKLRMRIARLTQCVIKHDTSTSSKHMFFLRSTFPILHFFLCRSFSFFPRQTKFTMKKIHHPFGMPSP